MTAVAAVNNIIIRIITSLLSTTAGHRTLPLYTVIDNNTAVNISYIHI